jgi:hypothetical protein
MPVDAVSGPAAGHPAADVVAGVGGHADRPAGGSVSRAPVVPAGAAGGGSAASAFSTGVGVAGGLLGALVFFCFARARFARALVAAVRPRSLTFVAVLERPG